MRLIVITQPHIYAAEPKQIVQLMDAGLQTLHLRKPGATEVEIERLILALPERYRGRIVTHDYPTLAGRYGLGGIHLNSRWPVAPEGYRGMISRSCHSLDEVERYSKECAYVFLSPIFDSVSKAGYPSAFSIDELRAARDRGVIDRRVVALGGITATRIPIVRQLGFGGVALLGDVWQTPPERFIDHFLYLQSIAHDD